MPVYKNEKNGTWYVMARYKDWRGERRQKCQRGFTTKREAQEWNGSYSYRNKQIWIVCHVKSSLAPEGKSIAFRLDKDSGFEWIGEYDISTDDLLSGNCRGKKIKEAKEFLLEILADGAVEQNVIIKESESRGIKGKTLWNAKKALGIQSIKPGANWSWVLPEQ